MKKMWSKKGFTVVELVVAMMLVAGIAMILMPSLVADNEKQVYATALKKMHTQLQQSYQAVGMLQSQGKLPQGETTIPMYKMAVEETMNLVPESKKGQYLNGYPAIKIDNKLSYFKNDDNTIVLKNGMFLCFDAANKYIIVDINGKKQPNIEGKDIFYFTLRSPKNNPKAPISVAPIFSSVAAKASCPTKKQSKNYCNNDGNCRACAERILEGAGKGKIDYF